MAELTYLYDNIAHTAGFQCDWGFSCLLSHEGRRILFDTGEHAEILEANLDQAGVDVRSIDAAILSHKHSDHMGGMLWLAEKNPEITFYLPKTWNRKLDKEIQRLGAPVVRISSYMSLGCGMHIVASQNLWLRELTLGFETQDGLVAVTGCSHTGICHIAKRVQSQTDKNLDTILGGFHLLSTSDKKVRRIANKLKDCGVGKIAPSHCTGDQAMKILEDVYGDRFLKAGAGARFEFVS